MLDDIDLHGERDEDTREGYQKDLFVFASLAEIDLKGELAEQYGKAKTLYANVETSMIFTPNQKAAALNAVTTILANITKEMQKVQNMERIRTMEEALVAALKTLPEDAVQMFYTEWEKQLASVDS